MVAALEAVRVKVSPLRARRGCGEGRVGGTVGAAGVGCRHRQGGLADRQGPVDVDHGVVREVRARRQGNDRVGPTGELVVARSCSPSG